MVDNVTLSAGSADGAVIATDDIGGVHYQYNKVGIGAGDTFTILVGGAGAVAAGVQRVTLASDDPAVALLGTIDTDTGGIATSLAVMDDWDNGASDGASVSGDVAHDGADAGEPVKIGGYAKAAAPTAVSLDGDRVNAWFLLNGSQAVTLTAAGALIGGDATNGLDVDVTRVTGTVTVDGSGVTQPVSHGALTELAAALNVEDAASAGADAGMVMLARRTDTPANQSGTDGDFEVPQMSAGRMWVSATVDAALPAGTNGIGKLTANSGVDIGDVDVLSIAAGTNSIGNVGLIGRTTGGLTIFQSIDLDESEEEVKATAGQIFSISAFNHTAAPLYLKFYNLTAANTTVGTSTPVATFTVPGNADSDGAGFVWNNTIGLAFGTAISAAVTTGIAVADTGAPAANACSVVIGYV